MRYKLLGGTMKEITTGAYEVWVINDEEYGILVKAPYLMMQINKVLKKYPEDTKFSAGEESWFKVPQIYQDRVDALLKDFAAGDSGQ